MKNIHILPTDKPSRLFIHNAFNDLRLDDENVLHDNNQNIYITSDEEIKEGDYAIYLFRNAVQKIQIGINFSDKTAHKKIILTTDQELIKEGVQAIDDDFLEWFVKNPRCESVEVDKNWNYPLDKTWEYKIIIPKEEPKDVVLGYKTSLDAQMLDRIEPKQETLEEAAKKQWGNVHRTGVLGFIDGAKWQQEQDKNESTADYIDRHLVQALVEVGKQNPAVYSEEDVKSVIEKTVEQCNKMMQESYGLLEIDVDYILEKFKKK